MIYISDNGYISAIGLGNRSRVDPSFLEAVVCQREFQLCWAGIGIRPVFAVRRPAVNLLPKFKYQGSGVCMTECPENAILDIEGMIHVNSMGKCTRCDISPADAAAEDKGPEHW